MEKRTGQAVWIVSRSTPLPATEHLPHTHLSRCKSMPPAPSPASQLWREKRSACKHGSTCVATGGGIFDFGGGWLEGPRQWLRGLWHPVARCPPLGVPSRPGPPGAPSGGARVEPGHCLGGGGTYSRLLAHCQGHFDPAAAQAAGASAGSEPPSAPGVKSGGAAELGAVWRRDRSLWARAEGLGGSACGLGSRPEPTLTAGGGRWRAVRRLGRHVQHDVRAQA